jgi:hypothetical protein
MTNHHELVRPLTAALANPQVLLALLALTALNVLGLLMNAFAFIRNQRRWRRVQARERRLDPGPITAAVGAFARASGE